MSKRSLFISLVLAGIVLFTATGCTEDQPSTPQAFQDAQEQELVLEGYQDLAGLQRVIEFYLEDSSNFRSSVIDESIINELNMDLQAIREIEALAQMDLSMYLVEFVPGFTGGSRSDGPIMDFNNLGLPDNDLTPGFPPRGSLVSQDGDYVTWSHTNTKNERRTEATYPDGSRRWMIKRVLPNGNVWTEEGTASSDGSITYFDVTVQDPDTGDTVSQVHREEVGEETNTAEEQRLQDEREREAERSGETGGEETGGEDTGGGEEDPGVDQYQPADGGGGTFCPLVVEVCRRGLEEAIESAQVVKVGIVYVNPGDPDDQPESGQRLVIDPEDLVINPDPNSAIRDSSMLNPNGFRMEIPVWVNPPGPNE